MKIQEKETQIHKFRQTKETKAMETVWTYMVLLAVAVVFSTTAGCAKKAGQEKGTNPMKDSAKPFLEMTDLFQKGKSGYPMYHTPSIAVSAKGTVLVWNDARKVPSDDAWSDILLRRSTDNGRTFSEPILIGHMEGKHPLSPGKGKSQPSDQICYHNPVLIPDRNGALHMLFCIEYTRAFYIRSEDDGLTWSKPVEITAVFEKFRAEYDWNNLATGPNHSIQLKNGRLVVPVWLTNKAQHKFYGEQDKTNVVAVVYSDDSGMTWHAGDIAVPATGEWAKRHPNETVAVELSDGRVMLHVRTQSGGRRAVTISPNGATDWSEPYLDDQLPAGTCARCAAGLVRYPANPDSGPTRLLLSLPSEGGTRRHLRVFMSDNDGRTWPVNRLLWGSGATYSDLAVTADGTILCFFGRGLEDKYTWGGDRLTLARFNMAWLLEGEPKGEYQLPNVAEDQIFGAGEDVKSKPKGEKK
jgi:sialidase-1